LIDRLEVPDFSREVGLAPEIVEKDYALGWMLGAIYSHEDLQADWLFKGGTCLKKCCFETYRFSEDLDFTLRNPDHLNQEFLTSTFSEIADWIYEQSGIELPRDAIAFDIYENPRGGRSVQGRIAYRGPPQRRGSVPKVKLDLTDDERIVLEPVWREVHHPYQDRRDEGIHALCYCYEELFAEKIRALAERMRPRDLYDVIHLYRHGEAACNRALVLRTLTEKCAFKGLSVPSPESISNSPLRPELESEWENMLAHQLPQLPPLALFSEVLPQIFSWLQGVQAPAALPVIPYEASEDATWHPPAMVQSWGSYSWGSTVPLETIRFAAANRLCVDLRYQGSHRPIEPYSLRRTRDGNIILHAVRHDSGEHRSYRLDRIEGALATRVPFTPRYAIELTPSGPFLIPETISQPRISNPARPPASRMRLGSFTRMQTGPRYVIQCMYCGRHFTKKSHETSLNPHKDKSGYPCPSRMGYLVETKY
jgi:predicted nucleotidyltransferase component of viral defense system